MTTPPREYAGHDLDRIADHSFLRRFEFHDELRSTSDRAIQCAADDALETPLLVLAQRQTAGRGRGGNRWWSGDGALAFSLVLDHAALGVRRDQLPQMSLVTALAVRDALQESFPAGHFQLKWPNDLFLNQRKVGGILIETATGALGRLVVGIGVNVNNSLADAPSELQSDAISMIDACGEPFVLVDVLTAVLSSLPARLEALATGKLQLPSQWKAHCLLDGQRVNIALGQQTIEGVCVGVDEQGALMVRNEDGLHQLYSGTVRRCM